MGIVSVCASVERFGGGASDKLAKVQTLGCVLAALNFALPLMFWKGLKKRFSKGGKSMLWLKVFPLFCASSVAFWAAGAYVSLQRA